MLEIWSETLLSLKMATKEIPGRPHISTVGRWWKRGVGGKRLEVVRIGGRIFTSKEAIGRFLAALSATASSASDANDVERTFENEAHLRKIFGE